MTRRSKRWFGSGAPSKKRAEQAHPPKRKRGQPRVRPARTASTMSMAARNAASISKCVVSSKYASGAGLKGAAARLLSRSSRRRISASTSASLAGVPARSNSAARRRARTSAVAVTKNLHVRIRTDHRADVAAVEHRAGRRAAKLRCKLKQGGAHLGNGRDHRRRLADRRGLEGRLVESAGSSAFAAATAGHGCSGNDQRRATPSPPRDRAGRCRDDASHNARRAACRACPCPTPPARRSR